MLEPDAFHASTLVPTAAAASAAAHPDAFFCADLTLRVLVAWQDDHYNQDYQIHLNRSMTCWDTINCGVTRAGAA